MHRRFATLLILAGAVCMSFAAFGVRLVDDATGLQILTYRSITLSAMVAFVACWKRRLGPVQFLQSLDRLDVVLGAFLALAFNFYIFALLNTSVGSALLLLSVAPIFAAFIGWIFLKERPSLLLICCIALAMVGVLIMVGDGIDAGKTRGNIYALMSAGCFAVMLVLARASRKTDVLGGTFLGGIFSMVGSGILAFVLGDGLWVSKDDLIIMLVIGAFTIGLGIALVTWGTPFVPAAEVALLVLLESVLAPIWVWLFLSETMRLQEIIGGIIILAAVGLYSKRSLGKT